METSQEDFGQLENDIEDTIDQLSVLQRKYIKLTGKEFIKPIRLIGRKQNANPIIRNRHEQRMLEVL